MTNVAPGKRETEMFMFKRLVSFGDGRNVGLEVYNSLREYKVNNQTLHELIFTSNGVNTALVLEILFLLRLRGDTLQTMRDILWVICNELAQGNEIPWDKTEWYDYNGDGSNYMSYLVESSKNRTGYRSDVDDLRSETPCPFNKCGSYILKDPYTMFDEGNGEDRKKVVLYTCGSCGRVRDDGST